MFFLAVRMSGTILREAVKSFFRDNCFNLSAAVAFYTMISVIPIIFLIFFVSVQVLGSSEAAYRAVMEFLKEINPYVEEQGLQEIRRLSERGSYFGWLGLGFLLWMSTMFVSSLETAFTIIFKVETRRNPLRSFVMSVSVIPVGFCAILFYVAVNASASYLELSKITALIVNSAMIRYIIPLSVIVLFFTLIYKIIPNRAVPFPEALLGGMICTLFLEFAKYLFGLYLALGGNPAGFVYGSLKALMYVVVWVFYIASITLFAGEIVSAVLQRKEN